MAASYQCGVLHTKSLLCLSATIVLGQYVLSVSVEAHFSGELCYEFVNDAQHLFPSESQFHLP